MRHCTAKMKINVMVATMMRTTMISKDYDDKDSNDNDKEKVVHEGGCHCGAVGWRVRASPLPTGWQPVLKEND